MDSEGQPVPLTAAQRRALSATLHVVEEAVERIERLLAAPPAALTCQLHQDLAPEERQAIAAACDRLRPALARASCRFAAGRLERSLRGEIRGECAVVWAAVQDSTSRALRGYGTLPSEAAAVVDAVLGEISEPLASILRALASARPTGTSPGCAPPAGLREPQP